MAHHEGEKIWFDTDLLRSKVEVKRTLEGLSGREAAKQIGVHHTTLLRLNTLNPDIQTATLICEWLKESLESFVRRV